MKRRAIALVLVLLVMVVAVTAAAAAARLSIATRIHAGLCDAAHLADSLRPGAEGFAEHFLRTQSATTVLPPDAGTPAIGVMADELEIEGVRCRVTITAYDECGMIPWGEARRGSPLRAALGENLAALWDRASTSATQPGLDLMLQSAGEAGMSVFPGGQGAEAIRAIGTLVATHNPDPAAARAGGVMGGGGLINVNTAPERLLRAAFQAAGASGIEEVLLSRSRAEPAAAPASRAPSEGGASWPVRLVSQSDAWAFRIDIDAGAVRRSWWCVYRATGSEWRCVQRVAISE